MSDEGVEDVLQRVREKNYAERVKRREDMYNKQRKIVAELSHSYITKQYKEGDVIKAAKALSGRAEKSKSFSTLKNAFIQNPCHMVSFMKVEGALHSLAGCLMSQNSVEQLLALECCCNLSLGDSKTCFKLSKAIAPYLVTILQGINHNLMDVALQTVTNLSGSGQKTCQLLYSQGILKVLERTIAIPELTESTAKALVMFMKNGNVNMTESEVQNLVVIIIPHFESCGRVQWLTYLLSSLPYVIPILIRYGMPARILNLMSSFSHLHDGNITSATALVRILGNLSTDPDGITASLMLDKWETTVSITKFFTISKFRHITKEMYWSLGNIVQHKNPQVKKKLSLTNDNFSWLGSGMFPTP